MEGLEGKSWLSLIPWKNKSPTQKVRCLKWKVQNWRHIHYVENFYEIEVHRLSITNTSEACKTKIQLSLTTNISRNWSSIKLIQPCSAVKSHIARLLGKDLNATKFQGAKDSPPLSKGENVKNEIKVPSNSISTYNYPLRGSKQMQSTLVSPGKLADEKERM